MAKSKKGRRVTSDNARRSLPVTLSPLSLTPFDAERQLELFEDRREWHPEGPFRPARSFDKFRHSLTVIDPPRPSARARGPFSDIRSWTGTKAKIAFQFPSDVLVCVRRKIRKEVMHAFKKAGKRGQKRPRRSWYSSISCKKGR